MKTLYFDCFSGIAGDMAVAALLDLGTPLEVVASAVESIGIEGLTVSSKSVSRSHLAATQYLVHAHEHAHDHRTFADVKELVERAKLTQRARALALDIFGRMAAAEAAIHKAPVDEVTFHEIGAADSIADIVGFAAAYDALNVEQARASRIPWTRGSVETAHGILPVPAPATLALLAGFVLEESDIDMELVTPTGAAILAATAAGSTGPGTLKVSKIGYGAGTKDPPGRPNLLRVVLGEGGGALRQTQVVLLEANIDDMDSRLIPPLSQTLFGVGALDVWITPIQMKKGRPAITLSALTRPDASRAVAERMLAGSTTLGVRTRQMDRYELEREIVKLDTLYGEVRFKVAAGVGRVEFEDALAIAERERRSTAEVITELERLFRTRQHDAE